MMRENGDPNAALHKRLFELPCVKEWIKRGLGWEDIQANLRSAPYELHVPDDPIRFHVLHGAKR